jgi:hypothetical protein
VEKTIRKTPSNVNGNEITVGNIYGDYVIIIESHDQGYKPGKDLFDTIKAENLIDV